MRLTRDVGAASVDTAGLEHVAVASRGGTDRVTVANLAGSGVRTVRADLGADADRDQAVVVGTNDVDLIDVSGRAGAVAVRGLQAAVALAGVHPGDLLTVRTQAGQDVVTSSGLAPGTIGLEVQ
jgi:hypothetical protein